MVLIGLGLASCRAGVAVEEELVQPERTPTAAGSIESTGEQDTTEVDAPKAALQVDLPQPTDTPILPPAPPTEVAITVPATAIPTATLPSGAVSLPPLNTERPADILQEVAYYLGGGGGIDNCSGMSALRGGQSWEEFPLEVAFTSIDGAVDWLNKLGVGTCGWEPGEQVLVEVHTGNEVVSSWEATADEWGSVWEYHVFGRDYPPGEYRFSFSGRSGELVHGVAVVGPQQPTIYHFFDEDKRDTGEILLAGFQPGERIRLVKYAGISHPYQRQFAGWATVQVGNDGQLAVINPQTDGDTTSYAAIGELSGEAENIRAYAYLGHMDSIESAYNPQAVGDPLACSGALPTRLAIGDIARVVADRLSVREGPGTNYPTVYGTSIGNGRTVTILDGPVCSDGMLWWKGETGLITLTNGEQHNIVGWMAEESGDEWLLEPVP